MKIGVKKDTPAAAPRVRIQVSPKPAEPKQESRVAVRGNQRQSVNTPIQSGATSVGRSQGARVPDPAKTRVRDDEFIYPTREEVIKRIDEEESGEYLKFAKGITPILILPARGIKYPWFEMRVHWCGGRDVMTILGLDADSRPEELPMAHACAKFHGNSHCEWCSIVDQLKKSRHKRDRILGGKLFANLRCECDAIDLRKEILIVQPLSFGKTIRDALLGIIGGGSLFFHHEKLRPIRVKKVMKGSLDWQCEYNVMELPESKGKAKPQWLAARRNLSECLPPIPTPDEAREVFDLLKAKAEIPTDSQEDVGSDIEQNYSTAGSGYNVDDLPF